MVKHNLYTPGTSFPYTLRENCTLEWLPYEQRTPIYYDVYTTSLGKIILMVTPEGICGMHFLVNSLETQLAIAATHFQQTLTHHREKTAFWENGMKRGMDKLPLIVKATPFQQAAWRALGTISRGTAISYQALAQRMGIPKSVRAVATSIGKNNIAVLIPCHRVIRKNGDIGKYRWGSEVKKALLQQEQQEIS